MGAAAPMSPVNLRAIRNGVDDDVVWGHRIGLIEQYFKCSEIDPTCLSGETINRVRQRGLRRLFLYKLTMYPVQTIKLLRRFLRYMPVRDVLYLIAKPFIGREERSDASRGALTCGRARRYERCSRAPDAAYR